MENIIYKLEEVSKNITFKEANETTPEEKMENLVVSFSAVLKNKDNIEYVAFHIGEMIGYLTALLKQTGNAIDFESLEPMGFKSKEFRVLNSISNLMEEYDHLYSSRLSDDFKYSDLTSYDLTYQIKELFYWLLQLLEEYGYKGDYNEKH